MSRIPWRSRRRARWPSQRRDHQQTKSIRNRTRPGLLVPLHPHPDQGLVGKWLFVRELPSLSNRACCNLYSLISQASPVDIDERLAFLKECRSNLIDGLGKSDAKGRNDAPREYSDVHISLKVKLTHLLSSPSYISNSSGMTRSSRSLTF
jgi:hypothetical protein